MSEAAVLRIEEIKKDPKYLKLKNKVRSNQENQTFQKYLREIAYLSNICQSTEVPQVAPRAVPPPATKPGAFRNQPKPVAWRNQHQEAKKNSGILDTEYEEEYNTRLQNYHITGKFITTDTPQTPQEELTNSNIVENVNDVNDVNVVEEVKEVKEVVKPQPIEVPDVPEVSEDDSASIEEITPPPVKKAPIKKAPLKKPVGRKPKTKVISSDSE